MTEHKELIQKDLEHFYWIARGVRQGDTLAEIGRSRQLAINTVRAVIERLEHHYGHPLVEFQKGRAGNSLTPQGTRLLEMISGIQARDALGGNDRQHVRLAVSTTLLTGQVLTPAIATALQNPSLKGLQVDIQVASATQLDDIARSLQYDKLEAAITWQAREPMRFPGLEVEEFGVEMNIVAVSHSDALRDRIESDIRSIEALRIAMLPRATQPMPGINLFPDYPSGGGRIFVDTFDAAMACVRARVADVCIVPAIYGELESARQSGSLFYTRELGKIRLELLTKKGKRFLDDAVIVFLNSVRDFVRDDPQIRLKPTGSEKLPRQFPTNPDFFRKIRFGYYVEGENEESDKRPSWKSETIDLSTAGKDRFEGIIKNQYNTEFHVEASLLHEKVLLVHARQAGPQGKRNDFSVDAFVSLFSLAWPEEGVIYGTWTGRTSDNTPVVFATIYSHRALTPEAIRDYSHRAGFRTSLSTDSFSQKFGH